MLQEDLGALSLWLTAIEFQSIMTQCWLLWCAPARTVHAACANHNPAGYHCDRMLIAAFPSV